MYIVQCRTIHQHTDKSNKVNHKGEIGESEINYNMYLPCNITLNYKIESNKRSKRNFDWLATGTRDHK